MDAQERQIYTGIIIAVVVIGAIIFFFVVSVIRQQRKVLKMQRENATAEITALEKDRARIAADLHDELSPILSAIKLKISTFDLRDEGDKIQQQKTNTHLNDLIKRMREISFDLMPVTLQRKGLVAALKELNSFYAHTTVNLEMTLEDITFKETSAIHLYRIVQEIIHNTIKHAGATILKIELKKVNDKIVLSTKDNGKGFNYNQQLNEGSGYGLRNLLSRTDLLGGELYIVSKKDEGTQYTIEIHADQ